MTKLDNLRQRAKRYNLYIARQSPGDGVSRYKFIKSRQGKPVSYYSVDGHVELGIGKAEAYLNAYIAGRQSKR